MNRTQKNSRRFADIVVFEDDEKKKPYIVIECKKAKDIRSSV
ncbi:MAG: type I restriction enzyme HsdR N-terminal domain-containing protein [Sphingobacteriales bacterium]|nr:type I restriction enzyme HsdR N-terminal domain-containing protein [Sphingobacteriales bacterium]